ncbi:MAG: hypothetical protein SFY95_03430 [Planctomycetota bacterium]|nr:hypothetical protein [Planctomycetota bacterium]
MPVGPATVWNAPTVTAGLGSAMTALGLAAGMDVGFGADVPGRAAPGVLALVVG